MTESTDNEKDIDRLIELYKSSVDVQKHFNELELKIRSFTITIFTFFLAGIGFCIKENINIMIFRNSIPVAIFVSIFGFIVVLSLFILDYLGYHKFLHSSVLQAIELENEISKYYPFFQLTKNIKEGSTQSPANILFFIIMLPYRSWKYFLNLIFYIFKTKYRIKIEKKFNSDMRIKAFYLFLSGIFWFIIFYFIINSNIISILNIFSSQLDKAVCRIESGKVLIINYKNTNTVPRNAGIIILKSKDGIVKAEEVSSIYDRAVLLDSTVFISNYVYYCEVDFGRKEISDYINSNKKNKLFESEK